MMAFVIVLVFIVFTMGMSDWSTVITYLISPMQFDWILVLPFLLLLFFFAAGVWVLLHEMHRLKGMGPFLLSRITERRAYLLWLLQKPVLILSTLNIGIFIPLLLLSSSSWQESIWIVLSIPLTWMLWYNAGNCLIWSGMSIRNAAFLLMVLYGVVQYAVLHNPALSFLVFNSSRLGKAPFPHMLIQFSLLIVVLFLLRGILQRYEEWGVDKYD